MSDQGRLTSAEDVRTFVLAGNATLTLVSRRTEARFTYRVTAGEAGSKVTHFVKVLTGQDNEGSYSYLGHVYDGTRDYVHGRKSRVGADAPSAKAFAWFWQKVVKGGALPDEIEVYHSGSCGRCGRKLTVPESIKIGLGPECAGRA
jgi:Family of unknown function (DUF6011)